MMSKPKRVKIPKAVEELVLHEAGYRCAVPTCQTILLYDIHHIIEVSAGGGNGAANLLVLCPTCHALYHRGKISQKSIVKWKAALVSLSQGGLIISRNEVRQIARKTFKDNFLALGGTAKVIASQRAFALLEKFLDALQRKDPAAIYAMADPDMQYSLFAAQRDYAKTGDKDLEGVLIDLLVERASQPNRSLMQITLSESLVVAPKLTIEQLDALSLIFLLHHTELKAQDNRDSVSRYIDDYYGPFIEQITTDMSCYLHLEYCGCLNVRFLRTNIAYLWINANNSLFQKGFEKAEMDSISCGDSRFDRLLLPCLNNSSLFQLRVPSELAIEPLCKQMELEVDPAKLALLANLHRRSTMHFHSEAKQWLIATNSKMRRLLEVWDKSLAAQCNLTGVGILIAHANFRRRTGHELDQKWDRSLSADLHWSITPHR